MNGIDSGGPSREEIQQRLGDLCKPPGSLGILERVAEQLCMTQKTLSPSTRPRSVSVFAADHGVTTEGVSAWPSTVTRAVTEQMQRSRTASGVFAKTLECKYEVVDVGLAQALEQYDSVALDRADRRGTANLRFEAAMSPTDFDQAWNVGAERAIAAIQDGNKLLIGGEMGIGNTTSATCLIALLCDVHGENEINAMIGQGAGADEAQLQRKHATVSAALRRVRDSGDLQAREVGRQVGGLEIAALAGYYATGASEGATILLDGVIATSAGLLAEYIQPGVRRRMMAGHCSTEPAHQIALNKLGLEPIQDLQMRLGEASGALAALPIVDLAAVMLSDMASLAELKL